MLPGLGIELNEVEIKKHPLQPETLLCVFQLSTVWAISDHVRAPCALSASFCKKKFVGHQQYLCALRPHLGAMRFGYAGAK